VALKLAGPQILWVKCFSKGCAPPEVLAAIDQRLGTRFGRASVAEDFADADADAEGAEAASPEDATRQALTARAAAEDQAYDEFRKAEGKRARVERMWDQAKPICQGDLADRYLRSRGLALDRFPPALRFHPNLWSPETNSRWPALVACLDRTNGTFCGAIQRTYLDPTGTGKAKGADGNAIQRLALGPVGGNAVQLFDPGGDALLVGEGIETVLSALVLSRWKIAGWATLGTSGMVRLAVPSRFRRVLIAADNDTNGAGIQAASALARRLHRAGLRVIIRTPEIGNDFNDELQLRLASHGGDAL
jgi:hypothetical protein